MPEKMAEEAERYFLIPIVGALSTFSEDGKPVEPVRFKAVRDANGYHLLHSEGLDNGDAAALVALLGVEGHDDYDDSDSGSAATEVDLDNGNGPLADAGDEVVIVHTAEEVVEVYTVEEAKVRAAIDEDTDLM